MFNHLCRLLPHGLPVILHICPQRSVVGLKEA